MNDKARWAWLAQIKAKYGLTPGDYRALLTLQSNCAFSRRALQVARLAATRMRKTLKIARTTRLAASETRRKAHETLRVAYDAQQARGEAILLQRQPSS